MRNADLPKGTALGAARDRPPRIYSPSQYRVAISRMHLHIYARPAKKDQIIRYCPPRFIVRELNSSI